MPVGWPVGALGRLPPPARCVATQPGSGPQRSGPFCVCWGRRRGAGCGDGRPCARKVDRRTPRRHIVAPRAGAAATDPYRIRRGGAGHSEWISASSMDCFSSTMSCRTQSLTTRSRSRTPHRHLTRTRSRSETRTPTASSPRTSRVGTVARWATAYVVLALCYPTVRSRSRATTPPCILTVRLRGPRVSPALRRDPRQALPPRQAGVTP
jgi:hypothetical protein